MITTSCSHLVMQGRGQFGMKGPKLAAYDCLPALRKLVERVRSM